MTINHPHASLLHVARPRECNTQQPPLNDATGHATIMQQPPTKPASLLELARNKLRNNHATGFQKPLQQAIPKSPPVVARVAERYHGLTLAELKEGSGEDWQDIEHDSKALEAMAHAIQTRRMRERGEIPPHYTSTTHCKHCGPVPIFPGGADTVLGCPCCFNRVKGLPVPAKGTGIMNRAEQ